MPIDPSIALGVKPMQIESPINQMAKVYELQNMQQASQANQLAMQEKQRALDEQNALRNRLAAGKLEDPTELLQYGATGRQAYESLLKGQKDTRDARSAELDALSKAHGIFKTTMSSIIATPTLANAINTVRKTGRILGEDVEDDVAELTALGENPDAIRKWAIGHSIEADKLMPKSERIDIGGSFQDRTIDPLTGLPTVVSTTQKTLAPGEAQRIALDKQRLGLEGQRVALDERRTRVAETTGAPGYVKPLNATQQYKLDKLKAADKTNAKLFDASIDAELKNIDKLIGTEAKPKLHKGLANATGPIASRLPTGREETSNAEAYIKSLQSKASINSLQAIRGTAGAIGTMTEREWPRLESMKATLQESQGTDQFIQSLKDYREELKNMKLKSKEALNTDYSTEIGANIPSANPDVDALVQKYSQE